MTRHTVHVYVEMGWSPDDTLWLYRGTENAAGLAGSTPAGGVVVAKARVGEAAVGSAIELSFGHLAQDKCATLPVGVSRVDAAGNASTVTEAVIQLKDPPQAPGRPAVAATANPGEATLSWLASPDV